MNYALVIGANSGIARALLAHLSDNDDITHVHAVSRTPIVNIHASGEHIATEQPGKVTPFCFDTLNEAAVREFVAEQRAAGVTYQYVVSTVGLLHRDAGDNGTAVKPEKRLEDIDPAQLQAYFEVNSILPALWLKHLVHVMPKGRPSVIAFLSARVGSISDNRLGGWYGYRASKAAMNMLIKNAAIEYARRNKHVALMAYHPGTVDTSLSKPFQANVASDKLFTPEFTAQRLLNLLAQAHADKSPYYVDWDGKSIPW